jgi:hypothetical protein
MLGRGHEVVVGLERHRGGLPASMIETFEGLDEHYPGFSYQQVTPRRDLWRIPAGATQRSLDYLWLLESENADAELRDGARDQAPRLLRALLWLPPFRWRPGRRALGWLLRRLEAGMPLPRNVKSLIKEQAPGEVIVTPLAELASPRGEFLRTAEAARVPSVLVATGWTEVPSERVLRDLPTIVLASSEEQTAQATHLYGLPSERIETVRAQSLNGLNVPAPIDAAQAIERAAATKVTRGREGRLLRPILWALTPLLAILLPLLRPRATLRDVARFFRHLRARIRKRRAARRKERARVSSDQDLTRAEARERKQARAEAKRERRARIEEAAQRHRAQAEARDEAKSEPPRDPANAGAQLPREAEKTPE